MMCAPYRLRPPHVIANMTLAYPRDRQQRHELEGDDRRAGAAEKSVRSAVSVSVQLSQLREPRSSPNPLPGDQDEADWFEHPIA
jgi:hypothetical protein